MSDKVMIPAKVTPLKPQDAARVVVSEQQLAIVRDVHARLSSLTSEWSTVLVLLGVDEARLVAIDFDKGHFVLKPPPDEIEAEGD